MSIALGHAGVHGRATYNDVCYRTAILIAILTPVINSPAARADDSGTSLSEMIVTATRVPEAADQALEPVIVIDRAALEDSLAIDVGDVLRFHAGIDIGRSGGPGQPLSVFIRGANSDQSIVMIDGVRINSGTQSLAALMNISPELFDSIEIVKGPRSAIYGTDAIGGVINLITRTGAPSGAEVLLDYGRYGSGEFAVDGNYTVDQTSVQAAFTGQQSAGFPTYAGDTIDAGYKNLSGTAAITTHLGVFELGARYYQATGATQYANTVYNADFTAFQSFTPQSEDFSNTLLALHASGDLTDIWHMRLGLSRVVDDLRQQQADPYALNNTNDFDYTSRDTIDWQNDVTIASSWLNQTLTFGAIVYDEKTNSLSYGTGYSIDTHAQTYYLQDWPSPSASHRLLLCPTELASFTQDSAITRRGTPSTAYRAEPPGTLVTLSAGTAFALLQPPTDSASVALRTCCRRVLVTLKLASSLASASTRKSRWRRFRTPSADELIVFVNDPTNLLYGGENENVDVAPRIRGIEAGCWS